MKVLVCGATGCIGSAVVRALRSRGHHVVVAARRVGAGGWAIDFMAPTSPQAWAERLRAAGIEAVVNTAGMLMARGGNRFERVHAEGPIELFEGCARAGVPRVVQVSALGADRASSPYLDSKRRADDALRALPLAGTVLRPSLVYGPGSESGRLFATLAGLPVVALPGGGGQALQPLHVYELAEIVTRCLERAEPACGVFELGGGEVMSYRQMLSAYRDALGLPPPLWLPLPMALMKLSARLAEALPQGVFSRDTLAMLERGSVPARNAAAELLGRPPSGLAAGLSISPPTPALDLRITLSPPAARLLRGAVVLQCAAILGQMAWAAGWGAESLLGSLAHLAWQLPLLAVLLLLSRGAATAPPASENAPSPRRRPSPPAGRRAA